LVDLKECNLDDSMVDLRVEHLVDLKEPLKADSMVGSMEYNLVDKKADYLAELTADY